MVGNNSTKYAVLWVVKGTEGFGISRATISLAKKMIENNINLKFLSISDGKFSYLLENQGFDVISLKKKPVSFFNKNLFFFIKKLYSFFLNSVRIRKKVEHVKEDFDFQKLIYRSPDLTFAMSLVKSKEIKKFWIMPNEIGSSYLFNVNKLFYQLAIRCGKIITIANSQYTKSTISGLGVMPKVLYLGVDENHFNPEKSGVSRDSLGLKDTDLVFGVFARFHYSKAQDLIIEAFKDISNEYPNLRLLMIGADMSDEFCKKCISLIKENKLEDKVKLHETVSDIEQYYPVVDIIINSRRDAEPFGLSIIEAMMMKKPVLAYAKGGPSETIIEGSTGWLINEPTIIGYYEGMIKVLCNRENYTSMGEKARDHALLNFSSSVFYKNFIQILNQTV